MEHFSLNIKACCLYVIGEKQDQIWAKIFCIPKIMHSRTPMVALVADIESMFHHIDVAPRDRDCLRFLWWPGVDMKA